MLCWIQLLKLPVNLHLSVIVKQNFGGKDVTMEARAFLENEMKIDLSPHYKIKKKAGTLLPL